MKNLLFLISVFVSLNLWAQTPTVTLQRGGSVEKTYGDVSSDGAANGVALTSAITDAKAGDEILLKGKDGSFDGVYAGTFTVNKNITIKGVGASAILKPVSAAATTTNRVMYISSADNTFVNLTITEGNLLNVSGAGAFITVGGNTFRDCLFINNQATSDGATAIWGGAIFLTGGQTVRTKFDNCRFINNAAWGNKTDATKGLGYGGAVGMTGTASAVTFTNCLFANNYAKTYGGALASGKGLALVDNLQFINCTVVNNKITTTTANSSAGLNPASGAGMTVINTVIAGNEGGPGQLTCGGASSYTNCIYEGKVLINSGTMTDCFQSNPGESLFVKPMEEAGFIPTITIDNYDANWLPSAASYLINRGKDIDAAVSTDVMGNPRKQMNFVDIGAYESANKGNVILKVSPTYAEIIMGGKFPSFSTIGCPEFPSIEGKITGLPANTNTVGEYSISTTLKNSSDLQYWNVTGTEGGTLKINTPLPVTSIEEETPIFIVMGQSNADASARANATEDARLFGWYDSKDNPNLMKIWYKSTYSRVLPTGPRWATEGESDVPDGWLDLYPKNDNLNGKTNMVMLDGNGTWSEAAAGRRGMEGEFGMRFQNQYPSKELYVFKLGCSGSAIATWVPSGDNHNWDYFFDYIYKPGINDLIAKGKKPRLVGIWWMQGESDKPFGGEYYEGKLREFIEQCRTKIGFENAPLYIGHVAKPGTNPNNPDASTHFDQGIRDAQNKVASELPNVFTISTDDCNFDSDNLHFSHVGINKIAGKVSDEVIKTGVNGWSAFKMPGKWNNLNQPGSKPVTFDPLIGTSAKQTISYSVNNTWTNQLPTADGSYDVKVSFDFGTWKDSIITTLVIDHKLAEKKPTITLKRGATIVSSYGDVSLSSTDNGDALAVAISEAQEADSLILIGKKDAFLGVYEGSITLNKAIVLKGLDNTVTLKASAANRVMQVNVANATFINLTFTGGRILNANGAGVNLGQGGSSFKNCLFIDNEAESDGATATWGGAMFIAGGQTARTYIENCRFINNAAWGNKSDATIGFGYGGAIGSAKFASPMTCTNCVFANNYAKTYGGAYASSSGVTTANNLEFINCTVVNNEISTTANSAALNPASGAGMTVINTVYYGNVGGAGQLNSGLGSSFFNCAYEGPIVTGTGAMKDCFQLKSGESLFAKPTEKAGFNPAGAVAYNEADWSLSATSYLINRGKDTTVVAATDILGTPRKQMNVVDLGAYESARNGNVGLNVSPSKSEIFVGQKIPTFSAVSYPSYPVFEAEVKDVPQDSKTAGEYTISATLKDNSVLQYWNLAGVNPAIFTIKIPAPLASIEDETPIFIVLGQSNADGSAIMNPAEDARLKAWYDDPKQNPNQMKIWYRSTYTSGNGAQGNCIFDGLVQDAPDGWMDLYYKNDNQNGKTSMVGVGGTYSAGAANVRRGMEGQFGMNIQKEYPSKALHVLKLGSSGSSINSWNDMGIAESNHNWNYFFEHIYKPAINDMIYRGMKPRLMGIWWMQGEANKAETQAQYEEKLKQFIAQSRENFGFAQAPIYIGRIVKPGESTIDPLASTQFGQGVRDAQNSVAANDEHVYIVDGKDCPFNTDHLHFDHVGVNMIADKISADVIAKGVSKWASYQTPGKWSNLKQTEGSVIPVTFTPSLGAPLRQTISYFVNNKWTQDLPTQNGIYDVKAVLSFETWEDEISAKLDIEHLSGNTSVDADNTLTVNVQNNQIIITNKSNESQTLTFHNALGQNVKQLNVVDYQTIIPADQFESGVYVVIFKGETQKGRTKIVLP